MMFPLRGMRMPVEMKFRIVFMNVRMLAGNRRMRRRKFLADPFHRASKIQYAQEDQHQADAKFHGQPDASRNRQPKQYDRCANSKNRQRMAEPPQNPDEGRFADGAFAADDGGNGDDVVGVRCMAHPQKETNRENGQSVGHGSCRRMPLRVIPLRLILATLAAYRRMAGCAPSALCRKEACYSPSRRMRISSAAACGRRAPRRETRYTWRGKLSCRTFTSFIQLRSISHCTHMRGTIATPMPICTKRFMLSMVGISMGILSVVRCLAKSSMTRRRNGDSTMCPMNVSLAKSSTSTSRRLASGCFSGTTSVSSSFRISVACN